MPITIGVREYDTEISLCVQRNDTTEDYLPTHVTFAAFPEPQGPRYYYEEERKVLLDFSF